MRIGPLLRMIAAFGLLLALPARGQEKIVVGPNVQVSAKNSGRAHWEIRIAADPANAQHLMACSFVHSSEQNSFHTIVYSSSDEGKTWAPTLESDRTKFLGDPDCVFGLNGTAYFSTLALHYESAADAETLIYRSSDGGWKWEGPVLLPFIDREYLTIDQTSGKFRGRIYLQGNSTREPTVDGSDKLLFTLFRSTDGAVTFQPPVKLIPDGTHMALGNGNGEILSDGSYVAVFPEWADFKNLSDVPPDKPVGSIKLVRSEDGGDTFSMADVIAPWHECRGAEVAGIPMLAVDHTDGPFKDRMYVVWSDKLSGHCDVRFSYSSDNGKTWSSSKVINDEPDQNSPQRFADHLMPVVTANNQGVVGIEWYDRRDNPDDIGWWVRFTASLDGGETFLPSVRVSEAPEAHKAGERLPIFIYGEGGGAERPKLQGATITAHIQPDQGENAGGDTGGIAADASGIFHPLWVDNRTGILQLWTAAVTVAGKAMRNGDEVSASLTDVSRSIALDFANTNYDPKTGLLSFDATLINTSKESIFAPIKLRVIGLSAGSGSVQIVNPGNHQNGPGAAWDFSDLVSGGTLKPEEKTGAKRFEFRLTGFQPFRRRTNGYLPRDFITLESKVLAKAPEKTSQ